MDSREIVDELDPNKLKCWLCKKFYPSEETEIFKILKCRHVICNNCFDSLEPKEEVPMTEVEKEIIEWVDGLEWPGDNPGYEGKMTVINNKPVTISKDINILDPIATFRPQVLHYLFGSYGKEKWGLMFGSDEGLEEGQYAFAIKKKTKEIPTLEQWLRQGPNTEDN